MGWRRDESCWQLDVRGRDTTQLPAHITGSGSICVIAGGGSGDARGAEIVGGHAKATTAVAATTVGAVGTAIKVRFLPRGEERRRQ